MRSVSAACARSLLTLWAWPWPLLNMFAHVHRQRPAGSSSRLAARAPAASCVGVAPLARHHCVHDSGLASLLDGNGQALQWASLAMGRQVRLIFFPPVLMSWGSQHTCPPHEHPAPHNTGACACDEHPIRERLRQLVCRQVCSRSLPVLARAQTCTCCGGRWACTNRL